MPKKTQKPTTPTSTPHPSTDPDTQVAALHAQIQDLELGWQRCQADFANAQRRWDEERRTLREYIATDTLLEIIPALDNFERAFAHLPDDHATWATGFQHIKKQLDDVLIAHGLVRIPTVGQPFNPTHHEAIMEESSSQPAGTILRDAESGYLQNGRVVKPAKVIVSSGQ